MMAESRVVGRAKRRQIEALATPTYMTDAQLEDELRELLNQDERSRRRWACPKPGCDGLPHQGWRHHHARANQRLPAGLWTVWLLLTGRGFGKTRSAAEAVREWVTTPNTQVAVVAKKERLVLEVCFDAPKAGLLAVIPPEQVRQVNRAFGSLAIHLRNGSVIRGFSAEVPDNVRGYAFDKAWLDEYASFPRRQAQELYDLLWFTLREAVEPQMVVSTTPKPLPHIKKLVERHRADEGDEGDGPKVRLTTGHTRDNAANLSAEALAELESEYGGTRMGAQELAGVLLEDVEGALWLCWMFADDGFRLADRRLVPDLERVVVAVDPAVTSTEESDQTAFTVAGRSPQFDPTYSDRRPRGYVLHAEQHRMTPEKAMRRAARLYHDHSADAVVLEANNGGDYLATVLSMVDPTVPYRVVRATRDKRARAAPVATLYEQGRVSHVGAYRTFEALEEQMLTYTGDANEPSPDLLDSLVWAMWDLLLAEGSVAGTVPTQDRRLAGRR
jgi:predicted phage terminase large subunit-like protein